MSDDLGLKLTRLADEILDELLCENGEKTPLGQRIDALKAISTMHLGMTKLSGKMPPADEGDGPSVPAMRERLKAVGGGE